MRQRDIVVDSNGRVCFKTSANIVQPTLNALDAQIERSPGVEFEDKAMEERARKNDTMSEAQRWLAPEVIEKKENIDNKQVDVFSVGVLLWEVETGQVPHGEQDGVNACRQIVAGTSQVTCGKSILANTQSPITTFEHAGTSIASSTTRRAQRRALQNRHSHRRREGGVSDGWMDSDRTSAIGGDGGSRSREGRRHDECPARPFIPSEVFQSQLPHRHQTRAQVTMSTSSATDEL
ncbi:hypothetical protein BLNAU_3212 [Blattamonas nauphoetae]|uniref:Protein kinase domain-containing protein n=1 Tax=Blattamonas nauphoetae TaxID=2049346 RepID=A0ABQ9YDK3_9EUKA|nr:hypothetical protein BLNAU_3212 [Blattamonas nauphoetae]